MKHKVCCCIGYRPKNHDEEYFHDNTLFYKEYLLVLEYSIKKYIKQGFDYFIAPATIGVGLDFAETVSRLREQYPHIKLEIVQPFLKPFHDCFPYHQERYRLLLKSADKISFSSFSPNRNAFRDLYRRILSLSDSALFVWDGQRVGEVYKALRYAKKRRLSIQYIGMLPIHGRRFRKNYNFYLNHYSTAENAKKKDQTIEKIQKMEEVRLKNKNA